MEWYSNLNVLSTHHEWRTTHLGSYHKSYPESSNLQQNPHSSSLGLLSRAYNTFDEDYVAEGYFTIHKVLEIYPTGIFAVLEKLIWDFVNQIIVSEEIELRLKDMQAQNKA